MGEIRIDPKKQFSKRLARWTSVFWFFYMTWLSVIVLLEPSAALYCVYMAIIVSVIMMTNVIAYTRNSIAEKLAFAMLNKAKIEIGLKSAGNPSSRKEVENDEEDLTDSEEGGGNG
ncbi:MAG: hypothetical protein IKH75_01250 [Ruminococcus sp.]|nr:hypothetical protein [Ruminococcus sp.]